MFTILVFTILVAVQFGFLYMKWSDIQDYRELYNGVTDATGISAHKKHKALIVVISKVLSIFQKLIIIPIVVLLVADLIVSLILGGILAIIF